LQIIAGVELTFYMRSRFAISHTSMKTSLTKSSANGCIFGETQHKSVHPHIVPRVKHLHRPPVAIGNRLDQRFVRYALSGPRNS
jgi:hypothetical protein